MKKELLLIGLALFGTFSFQTKAEEVCLRHKVKDNGYSRSVLPQVTGDLEAKKLILDIYRYTGVAQICVSDNNGNVVHTYSEMIQGKNIILLDFGGLSEGQYTVIITLGDNIYIGIVEL